MKDLAWVLATAFGFKQGASTLRSPEPQNVGSSLKFSEILPVEVLDRGFRLQGGSAQLTESPTYKQARQKSRQGHCRKQIQLP